MHKHQASLYGLALTTSTYKQDWDPSLISWGGLKPIPCRFLDPSPIPKVARNPSPVGPWTHHASLG